MTEMVPRHRSTYDL